ncbi:hypothetical protein EJB05_55206, partial [Eragrostis curvula]
LPTFEDFGGNVYIVADQQGFESVVHYVAGQYLKTDSSGAIVDPRLKLKKAVQEINYSKHGITVKTDDGCLYEADYVMVSVSLGLKFRRMETKCLRKMFPDRDVPDATDILVPRWGSDKFFKGGFTSWPIGMDRYEYDLIREPVGRVLLHQRAHQQTLQWLCSWSLSCRSLNLLLPFIF